MESLRPSYRIFLAILVWAVIASPAFAAGEAAARADAGEITPEKDEQGEDHSAEEHKDGEHGDKEHKDDEHADEKHEDGKHGDGEHKDGKHGKKHKSSRLSDEKIPLQTQGFPERPKPIVELGEPFLGTGTLRPGITLPTGAVWQPSLLLFGTYRTAIQTFEPDDLSGRITEWTNRLDLFFNLQLSGSERLVVGIRALDEDGQFSGYFLEHPDPTLDGEFQDAFSADIEALYFEGDFGEIFPNMDLDDFGSTDVGFSVGRQPLLFQEGMLINDTLDGIGFTRNTLLPRKTSNFRLTFFYGWDNINISNAEQRSANLFALLSSTDFRKSTVDFDVAYIQEHSGDGDFISAGVSAVQRINKVNTAFRILGSSALDEETATTSDGILLFSEFSWTPHYTHDHVYATAFAAFDEFTPAARGIGPASSGPLGRAGINFAAAGIGSFGAPLSGRARDVVGGAFGYQKFYAENRRQLLIEAATRIGIDDAIENAFSTTVRYQVARGQHTVWVFDGFVGYRELDDEVPYGGRIELLVKF